MPKYKYEEFDNGVCTVVRCDNVFAFCPMADGKRSVVPAVVDGINKNTIRVRYECDGKEYETTVGPRYFCK